MNRSDRMCPHASADGTLCGAPLRSPGWPVDADSVDTDRHGRRFVVCRKCNLRVLMERPTGDANPKAFRVAKDQADG